MNDKELIVDNLETDLNHTSPSALAYDDSSLNLDEHRDYWDDFYRTRTSRAVPSDFCKYVLAKYDFSGLSVVDFCCGDGRDTDFIAKYAKRVVGVDFSSINTESGNIQYVRDDIKHFIQHSDRNDFDLTYSRFGLHSLSEEYENAILQFSKTVFFEFRSDKDQSFVKDHFRRTINGQKFIQKVIAMGYEVFYYIESTNLAVYKDQDPVIIRIIASKVLKGLNVL